MKLPIWFWHWAAAVVLAPVWVPPFVCDVVRTHIRERRRENPTPSTF